MNGQGESFVVDAAPRPLRLDRLLQLRFPTASRATLQRWIGDGHVLVDGQPAKPSQRARAGQIVVVHAPAPAPATALAEAIALEVLYEDDWLLVVNKAAGMVVHPAAGHARGTLVNALLHHCKGQLSGVGGVMRPGIVHRLDKDTSGCLVVAKDDATHAALSQQFSARTAIKVYHAIVCGAPPRAAAKIETAIARHPTQRKKMAVVTASRGRAAQTGYRVLSRAAQATLVEATLHTGRTHQIRVHFQHLGCPVVGDLVYGGRPAQHLAVRHTASRQMLHAWSLTLTHPSTHRPLSVKAPWPADFHAAWTALGGPDISL